MKKPDINSSADFELTVPESVHARIEETLASLPEKNAEPGNSHLPKNRFISSHTLRTFSAAAACFFLVFTFILPNVSTVYAAAVSDIPLLGSLVRVFTVRNYTESDKKHEISVNIPAIESGSGSAGEINADIASLTETVIERFRNELGDGAGSLHISYETVTNTENWFTLKLSVSETSGSGYNYAKYCHIDRKSDTAVTFIDLFGENGISGIAEIILGKMKEEMAADSEMVYWVDEITVDREMLILSEENIDSGIFADLPHSSDSSRGESSVIVYPVSAERIPCVTADQNFYFTDDGSLVVVYDEYTVAPGSMGCPEIVLTAEEYTPFLTYGK